MALFKVGDKVLNTESKEHGYILVVKPARRGGHQNYLVKWDDREELEQECDLQPDCNISDPFVRCQNYIFDGYLDFSRKNTTYKIKNSNNSTVSSLKASKTLFRAYQFKPLMKFLNSPTHRLLIADEVGLGKTIEAGHIMLELKARKQLRNVLIICPLSLKKKWYNELLEKFGLQFKIYDRADDLIADLISRPGMVKGIVNYEMIRAKKIKDEKKTTKTAKTQLLDLIQTKGIKFSLILCDEAHKLRNSSTMQYKGAEILMPAADSVVFLTATPVMIGTENLFNLLHLLDNEKYYDRQIFDNLLRENVPFVHALTELNSGVSMDCISEHLKKAEVLQTFTINKTEYVLGTKTVDEKFQDFPLYQRIIERLNGEDTNANRAKLQYDLSNMSVMNNVFSRTRKRDVIADMSLAQRKPHPRPIKLFEREQKEFDAVIEQYYDDNSYVDYWGEITLKKGAALGLVQKKRQIASSVYAYLNDEESLDNGMDEYSGYKDAKVEELKEIIKEVFTHGQKKIIVFALFHKTLKYLSIRLRELGYGTLMIYGETKNRHEVLSKFKNDPNSHILLSSEVGSEGLDMQFCNSLVNYDLPWNPMVVEQRIGRIDRFGQKSPTVNIYNIIVSGSIQEQIYERLLDRIGIFRGTIGDMEAILDAEVEREGRGTRSIQQLYSNLEKDLYCSKLTLEEQQRRIEEVERAIENVKEETRRLEKELTNSLTNDEYFRDEIARILKHNSYVTDVELKNYLLMLLREYLTTCELTNVGDDVYEIKVPKSQPRLLQNFLTAYQPAGEEMDFAFRQFKKQMEDMDRILITFNQQKAYEDPNIIFMNIYHPIILACLKYFMNYNDENQKTFSFSLYEDDIVHKDSTYMLGVYQVTTQRDVYGVTVNSETLKPVLYSFEKDNLEEDIDIVDHLYGLSQTVGLQKDVDYTKLTPEKVDTIGDLFIESISSERKNQRKELILQMDNEKKQNIIQIKAYFESRRKSLQQTLREQNDKLYLAQTEMDDKGIKDATFQINTTKGRIEGLHNQEMERIQIVESAKDPEVKSSLISLSYITVV